MYLRFRKAHPSLPIRIEVVEQAMRANRRHNDARVNEIIATWSADARD